MKKVYISRHAGRSLARFLAMQGYELNTVTEYGLINEHTSDINAALGLERSEDGRLHPTRPVHVDPRMIMSKMPVSQRQMVEIGKAVSFNSRIITRRTSSTMLSAPETM